MSIRPADVFPYCPGCGRVMDWLGGPQAGEPSPCCGDQVLRPADPTAYCLTCGAVPGEHEDTAHEPNFVSDEEGEEYPMGVPAPDGLEGDEAPGYMYGDLYGGQ